MKEQKKKNVLTELFSGKRIFSVSFFSFLFFCFVPCPAGEKFHTEKEIMEALPPLIAPFRKGRNRDVPGGKLVSYKIPPSGAEFLVFCGKGEEKILSDDPYTKENRKTGEKLFADFAVQLKKDHKGTVTLLFEKELTFPALAGKEVRGRWRQYQTGVKKPFSYACRYIAFYRGNIVRIDFLPQHIPMPANIRQQLFSRFVSSLVSSFYEGERVVVPEGLRKILLASYGKLLSSPANAMEEAHALTSFVNESSLVFVKIADEDLVWYRSLVKGSPKEQKYAGLLFSAYMAGNAIAQIKEGICLDRRTEGISAMKKVYAVLKEKDPAFSIPELEK